MHPHLITPPASPTDPRHAHIIHSHPRCGLACACACLRFAHARFEGCHDLFVRWQLLRRVACRVYRLAESSTSLPLRRCRPLLPDHPHCGLARLAAPLLSHCLLRLLSLPVHQPPPAYRPTTSLPLPVAVVASPPHPHVLSMRPHPLPTPHPAAVAAEDSSKPHRLRTYPHPPAPSSCLHSTPEQPHSALRNGLPATYRLPLPTLPSLPPRSRARWLRCNPMSHTHSPSLSLRPRHSHHRV